QTCSLQVSTGFQTGKGILPQTSSQSKVCRGWWSEMLVMKGFATEVFRAGEGIRTPDVQLGNLPLRVPILSLWPYGWLEFTSTPSRLQVVRKGAKSREKCGYPGGQTGRNG